MANNHDVKPHAETWHGFVSITFKAAVGVIVLLVLMALFLI